ncbi:hypothetical protein J5Y03_10180 [Bacillus sp. RG28]|uniref:Uncharacterized protein n=1 Tax=Gottfriedia endophytica TaxID=2820819 RepID=A0A940SJ09_9BACI|nr:hypothetical protein [Gottfriedia endophytica]MBP0725555.1 hypothetical protein [Gottfriedia endophytica]
MNKEDLLLMSKEVFKMYQSMPSDKKRYLYPAMSGFLESQIRYDDRKDIKIEELLLFVKSIIVEETK